MSSSALALPIFDELERARVRAEVGRALFGGATPVRLGRFEICARIGSGAMGVVYSARDPELERTVALKVLDSAERERKGERLLREAQALARLSHPNVVAVHDVGRDAGRIFIAMELIEGDRLDVWVKRSPGWRETLRVLLEAGAGLDAAHARGLVHRDVKPSNIVVEANGRARVIDFGLARVETPPAPVDAAAPLAESLTRTRAFVGTPAYAAPEQLRSEAADARSDQYSYAATAWEALAGAPPFGGQTIEERLAEIRAARRGPAPSTVPTPILEALRRALRFDPSARFPSVGALMEALTSAARRASLRRWGTRAATLGAGVAIAAIGLWWTAGERERDHDRAAGGTAAPALAPVLSRSDSVLACPPLEIDGAPAERGWLGAAAASMACRRAVWILGGRDERVLYPGALLDLPTQPAKDRISDPWAREDARASALAAASSRATALLAGHVGKRGDRFVVTLRVEPREGVASSDATGESEALHVAVREAMMKLETRGAIPIAKTLDPDVMKWTGVSSPAAGALLAELVPALEATPDAASVCRALEPHAAALETAYAIALESCDTDWKAARPDVALDETSIAALARTAPVHFHHPARSRERQVDIAARAAAVAARLAEARRTEASSIGKRTLALAEVRLWQRAGKSQEAAVTLLQVSDLAPADWSMHSHAGWVSVTRSTKESRAAPGIAWAPDVAAAWASASAAMGAPCEGHAEDCAPPPERLLFQRRAYELGPMPGAAMVLARRLLEAGHTAEARALGARLAARSADYHSAAALALGLADAKDGWLGRGLAAMTRALLGLDALRISRGDLSLLIQTTRLAEVVGARSDLGERVALHFVLAEPHRLPGAALVDVQIAAACMHAPRAVALRCIARLRGLRAADARWAGGMEGSEEFMDGAERFARGDRLGAAKVWRAFAATSFYWGQVPVEVFDEAGEIEVAAQLDAMRSRPGDEYGGAHPAFVRQARRAATRGDRDLARRLAQKVVDAWGSADVTIPAVAEMRALLSRLPR